MEALDIKTNANMRWVSWHEVRNDLVSVNPQLCSIIDAIDPGKDYLLLKVCYPFGAPIYGCGEICSTDTKSELDNKNELCPVMFSLNKSSEIFLEAPQRILSLVCAAPGQLFTVPDFSLDWKHTKPNLPWRIVAGARSLFMLPKITDASAHKRLRAEFQLPFQPPTSIWEHQQIFRTIAERIHDDGSWRSEVIFFTRQWFNHTHNSAAWSRFRDYIYYCLWQQSLYFQQQQQLCLYWPLLAPYMTGTVKLRPYLFNTINHIVSIASRVVPGFQVANINELTAPVALIEKAYTEVYGLKNYLPIIMRPSFNMPHSNMDPRYYSLAWPTIFESYPTSKTTPNLIHDLKDIKYLQELLQMPLRGMSDSVSANLAALTCNYFHTHGDSRSGILSAQDMPACDPSLTRTFYSYQDRIFPAAGPFVRSCIQIMPLED